MADKSWPTNYATAETALAYRCDDCGAHGVKLWREYSMFLNHQKFRCVDCALKNQATYVEATDGAVGDDGRRESKYGRTDQIGNLIPAVPLEDGSTFWGYSSVPQEGVEWWRRLPLRS